MKNSESGLPGTNSLKLRNPFDYVKVSTPANLIEIFRTNISDEDEADLIRENLLVALPDARINFDLQDCDKILRIEGNNIPAEKVIDLVISKGYLCEILN